MSNETWFDSLCSNSDATYDATVSKYQNNSSQSVFCGAFSATDEAAVDSENIDVREEDIINIEVSTENVDTRTDSVKEDFRCSFDDDEGDDGSVVSDSGSVLSIDFENNKISDEKGEVDLSKIDDDESVAASEEEQVVDPQEETIEDGQFTDESSFSNIVQNHSRESSKQMSQEEEFIRNIYKAKTVGSLAVVNSETEGERKAFFSKLKSDVSSHGRYSLVVADTLVITAKFHHKLSQLNAAETLYKEAIDIYSCKLGDNDCKVTELQVELGKVKEKLGKYKQALDLYSRSFFMNRDIFGMYHVSTCDVRCLIARILQSRGFHKEALRDMKRSLKGYRETYGDQNPTVAESVENIARCYADSGDHSKAKNVLGELLKLRIALHGNTSIELATCLVKLADTHEALNDLVSALKTMKQAYVMFHALEGTSGTNTEVTLEKIGFLYTRMGKTAKAVKAHTSVALMRKAKYTENSIELAGSYLTLGKAYMDDGKMVKSLKALNRAISSYGKANDSSNSHISELMETLHTIGLLHQKEENYEKAQKAFIKENNIRMKHLANDNIGLAKSMYACGAVSCAMGKYQVGKDYLAKALYLYDKHEGRKLMFAEILNKYGQAMQTLKHIENAKIAYKESMQILMLNRISQNHDLFMRVSANCKDVFEGKHEIFHPCAHCTVLDRNSRDKFEI